MDYIQHLYPTVLNIQRLVTYNQSRGIFGFNESDNIGKQAFPAVQAAPAFSACFPVVLNGAKDMPCLIPQAIDQVPHVLHPRSTTQSSRACMSCPCKPPRGVRAARRTHISGWPATLRRAWVSGSRP
jgi:tryptophanyl-tRNA synthetase